MTMWKIAGMAAVGCACVLLSSGCGTTEGTEGLTPEALAGNYPAAGRTALGEPVMGVNLEAVLFAYDSSQVRDSEMSKIQAAAKYMIENSRYQMVLEGHCDERGSNEYNMSLGERRAQAVRENLIRMGIGGESLHTKSYGEEKPVAGGHDESAWQVNRRVEFAVYK